MKPLLTYFDVRGRAEPVRVMLIDLGVEFDERRITMAEWPTAKPEFFFGQVPTYQDGDIHINQSHAIYRHLARKYDLYGDDELERIRCDIIEEAFVDAQLNIAGFCWNPQFTALREDYETTKLPPLLERLQKLLDLNDIYNRDAVAGQKLLNDVYAMLKAGGVLGVIDHAGNVGADNKSLHRMPKRVAIDGAQAAGFILEAESNALVHPNDDHSKSVFDPSLRGKTDQFVLKLRKPQ